MSKNITIQEGGVGKNLSSIKKIETSKQGGGSVTWVPEDEVNLKTKSITKNGTYKAKDSNAYGFSEVTVNVGTSGVKPGSGTPPSHGGNGNDNEYNVETNPETGELEETLLPSSIKIVGNPAKTTYDNGEAINKAGMVVKAYKNDGTLYDYSGYQQGMIPLSELTIDPTTASSQGGSDAQASSSLDTSPVSQPIPCGSTIEIVQHWHGSGANAGHEYEYITIYEIEDGMGTLFITSTGKTFKPIIASDKRTGCTKTVINRDKTEETETTNVYPVELNDSALINNKIVYYHIETDSFPSVESADAHPVAGNSIITDTVVIGKIAWTMVYGTIKRNTQKITVSWERPKDQKELTDKFEITVNS